MDLRTLRLLGLGDFGSTLWGTGSSAPWLEAPLAGRRGGDRGGYDDRRGDDRDAPPPGDDKKDAPAEQGLNEDLDNYFANAPKDEAAPPPGGDEVPA